MRNPSLIVFLLCLGLPVEASIPVRQWIDGNYLQRKYPEALTSLVTAFDAATGADLDPSIQFVESIDATLPASPILYINAGDINQWPTGTAAKLIRDYVEHGGILWIDAGLQAPFLQDSSQVHSYAAWNAAPAVLAFLKHTFNREPEAVPLTHELFKSWVQGLPDGKDLPNTVRDYVTQEKWPNGTYSVMGLRWGTQYRVILTPIIAMGWGRDYAGNWSSAIGFRTREYDPTVEAKLKNTVAHGKQYEVQLADNSKEYVFCETGDLPAWVREPSGRYRLFKYYRSSEINDYAHQYYTQLGINILYYSLMSRR